MFIHLFNKVVFKLLKLREKFMLRKTLLLAMRSSKNNLKPLNRKCERNITNMYDDQFLRDYEFEQLQLANLRRIHRVDQSAFWIQENKQKISYFAALAAFGLGYILGMITK